MIDYSKLQSIPWLQQVPRTLTPEVEKVLNDIRGKPAFFVFWGGGAKGWQRDMENARLSFVYVVQANECLFDPAEAQFAPAVFLSTPNLQASDPQWMERTGAEISQRLANNEFPEAAAYLAAEDSSFDLELPGVQNGPFRLWTTHVDPDNLPGQHIPASRVLPALHHGKEWSLIPPTLYA